MVFFFPFNIKLAVLVTLHDWVDFICIGFWGGVFMVLAGMWTLQKRYLSFFLFSNIIV